MERSALMANESLPNFTVAMDVRDFDVVSPFSGS